MSIWSGVVVCKGSGRICLCCVALFFLRGLVDMSRVELAVYDLSNGLASQMSQAILGQQIDGIWHTGVIVYNYEYFFGGGIQKLPRGQFTTSNGLRASRILPLGETTVDQHTFEQYLNTIRHRYTQETYDLLNHNCNNFSNEITQFLLGQGQGIPSYIIDLPRIVFSTPGGQW
jgi:desumoylating isopeptidase 1